MAPAAALRRAQQWVRDTSNEEKSSELEVIWENAGIRMSAGTAVDLYRAVALEEPGERTFAHPFWWAAFTYTGV